MLMASVDFPEPIPTDASFLRLDVVVDAVAGQNESLNGY
jgi:hypothetical protein